MCSLSSWAAGFVLFSFLNLHKACFLHHVLLFLLSFSVHEKQTEPAARHGGPRVSYAASFSPITDFLHGLALELLSHHCRPSDLLQHLYFSNFKLRVTLKVTLQLTPESKTRSKGYTVSQRNDPFALGLWEALI